MNDNSKKLQTYMMHASENYSNFSSQNNPFGNFKPVTTNKFYGSYDESHKENNPIIDKHDFRNKHNTLHNNLADSLINEHVTEYRINVDAFDRDANVYPDPFKFTVNFEPPSRQSIKEKVFIDPNDPSKGKTIATTYIGGPIGPVISRKFRNVKYVKIESLILPRFHRIVNDEGNYAIDGSESVDDDRFIIVEIPELKNATNFGSNIHNENGFIIYPDRVYNTTFSAMTFYANRVFDDSALANVERLTINVKNSYGEPYSLKIVDTDGKPLNEKPDTDKKNKNNLNNVYHKIFQTHITFVIGVVENQLNTITKYEK